MSVTVERALALLARIAPALEVDAGTARLLPAREHDLLLVDGSWHGAPEQQRWTGRGPGGRRVRPVAERYPGGRGWVLRIPRTEATAHRDLTARRLLLMLRVLLPVPVPDLLLLGSTEPDGGRVVTGHPALSGRLLTAADVTADRAGLLVAQTTGLLTSLHDLGPRQVTELGAGTLDLRGLLRERAVDRRQRELVDDDTVWLTGSGSPLDEPVPCHGGLADVPLLVDPARSLLTGVLGFDAMVVADPALDLGGLLAGLGEPAFAVLAAAYDLARPGSDRRAERAGLVAQLLHGVAPTPHDGSAAAR